MSLLFCIMENNTLALRFIIDNQLKTYWVDPNHSSRDGEKTRHLLQNLLPLTLFWPVRNNNNHDYTNWIVGSLQMLIRPNSLSIWIVFLPQQNVRKQWYEHIEGLLDLDFSVCNNLLEQETSLPRFLSHAEKIIFEK